MLLFTFTASTDQECVFSVKQSAINWFHSNRLHFYYEMHGLVWFGNTGLRAKQTEWHTSHDPRFVFVYNVYNVYLSLEHLPACSFLTLCSNDIVASPHVCQEILNAVTSSHCITLIYLKFEGKAGCYRCTVTPSASIPSLKEEQDKISLHVHLTDYCDLSSAPWFPVALCSLNILLLTLSVQEIQQRVKRHKLPLSLVAESFLLFLKKNNYLL